MHDFYGNARGLPSDQADGLRRLFSGRRRRFIPLAANPHVAFTGAVIDRVTAAFVATGRKVLVVDAAENSPAPNELALLELASCIETVSPQVLYLAARGLPLAHVDTRGSSGAFLDAVGRAAPEADVVLMHAGATDLARMFMRRAARPLVLGADHPESIKHAYAACKLLAQRCGLMTFDLLLAADARSRRVPSIAATLASCADGFLGAVLHDWAVVDPAGPNAGDDAALQRLLQAQMALEDEMLPPAARGESRPSAAAPLYSN